MEYDTLKNKLVITVLTVTVLYWASLARQLFYKLTLWLALPWQLVADE